MSSVDQKLVHYNAPYISFHTVHSLIEGLKVKVWSGQHTGPFTSYLHKMHSHYYSVRGLAFHFSSTTWMLKKQVIETNVTRCTRDSRTHAVPLSLHLVIII